MIALEDKELHQRMFEIATNERALAAIREVLLRADRDALGVLKTSRDPDKHAEAIQILQHNERFLTYFLAALAAAPKDK